MSETFYSVNKFIYVGLGEIVFSSPHVFTEIGLDYSESIEIYNYVTYAVSESTEIEVKIGEVFITWTWDEENRRAVGTLSHPLYNQALFQLSATDGIKNPRDKQILNPQSTEFNTIV